MYGPGTTYEGSKDINFVKISRKKGPKAANDPRPKLVLAARPFMMTWQARRVIDDLRLAVHFNRPMAEAGQVGELLPAGDWPVVLTPNPAAYGRWETKRDFVLGTKGLSDEEYQKIVIGTAFQLAPNQGARSLTGETLGPKSADQAVFDSFRLIEMAMAGFDEQGRTVLSKREHRRRSWVMGHSGARRSRW